MKHEKVIGWTDARIFSNEVADEFKDSGVRSSTKSKNSEVELTKRVMLVWQIYTFGAEPAIDALTYPEVKPYMLPITLPTTGPILLF